MQRRRFLLPIACLTLLGCHASALQQGPSETLRTYARALDEGRADDAYKLLSSEAKRNISPDAFRRMVKENAVEMKDIAHALSRPASDPVVTATVTSPKGDSLLLLYEEGRWKLDGSSIDLYGQLTPRQAIEAFLRAFERSRYDVMLRFVPDSQLEKGLDSQRLKQSWEGAWKEEMQRITAALKAALPTAQFEELGDRATMAYGSSTLQLLREHGAWKIEDFD
ncbi:MAG TPA: hypothetical protein VK550_32005 [Polyangiaceae bacterium]|nr:hypothetical protein [Polyangiaceae bacterium]